MNRRNFIKNSITGASALTLKPEFMKNLTQDYELIILATNWGFGGSLEDFIKKAQKEGYDGVELWWPADKKDQEALKSLITKYDMKLGFLCGAWTTDFKTHFSNFSKSLNALLSSDFQPLYVNCHAGKDYFSFEENSQIVDFCIKKMKETGVKILQETHRSRMCFSTVATRNLLEKFPEMKLTLDISHWCNVHESMLDDQKETVSLALSNTAHIHARIGHEEGPQVNDPRAPEWKTHLDKHLDWWDQVVKNRLEAGAKKITFLTEFGPPTYLPALPYTRQPLADQWEINVFMKNLLHERYGKK